MSDLIKGHTFVAAEVVEAQSLNELVDNAVIQPTLISEKVLKDPAAMSDRILIEDSGSLKGITIQQIVDLVTPVIQGAGVPLGSVTAFAGPNAPTNWMFCYGQLLDRDVYADLFAQIGTTYSAGDGTSTFGLPDYRSCVLAGKTNMGGTSNGLLGTIIAGTALGAFAGTERHTTSVNEMPSHGHSASGSVFAGFTNFTGNTKGGTGTFEPQNLTLPVTVTVNAAGGNQPHNNLQPTKIVNYIIKVLN